MDLFQHFVNVNGVGLLPPALLLLVSLHDSLLGLAGLLGSLSAYFWGHDESVGLKLCLLLSEKEMNECV